MKAVVLVDNIGKNNLTGEWGLSVYIHHEGHHLLLDTGTTELFAENAKKLGIALQDVEAGVLSHAHYDHANGMAAFFELNQKAPFYLRKGAGENCYRRVFVFQKYIGVRKGCLKQYNNRIRYADGDYELMPNVFLIPHKTQGLDQIGKKAKMYVKERGGWKTDRFDHEQSLVIRTGDGLVIFNSCSHGGVVNIIHEVQQTFLSEKIAAFIGGFHLFEVPDEEVRALAAEIINTKIPKVITGHCTGKKAFNILKEELGERAEQMYTGMEIVIGEEDVRE